MNKPLNEEDSFITCFSFLNFSWNVCELIKQKKGDKIFDSLLSNAYSLPPLHQWLCLESLNSIFGYDYEPIALLGKERVQMIMKLCYSLAREWFNKSPEDGFKCTQQSSSLNASESGQFASSSGTSSILASSTASNSVLRAKPTSSASSSSVLLSPQKTISKVMISSSTSTKSIVSGRKAVSLQNPGKNVNSSVRQLKGKETRERKQTKPVCRISCLRHQSAPNYCFIPLSFVCIQPLLVQKRGFYLNPVNVDYSGYAERRLSFEAFLQLTEYVEERGYCDPLSSVVRFITTLIEKKKNLVRFAETPEFREFLVVCLRAVKKNTIHFSSHFMSNHDLPPAIKYAKHSWKCYLNVILNGILDSKHAVFELSKHPEVFSGAFDFVLYATGLFVRLNILRRFVTTLTEMYVEMLSYLSNQLEEEKNSSDEQSGIFRFKNDFLKKYSTNEVKMAVIRCVKLAELFEEEGCTDIVDLLTYLKWVRFDRGYDEGVRAVKKDLVKIEKMRIK
ncbi:uncharacterized protein MONOS_7939 [Monocercomonoides exilis]|uniref:uncharacterized protein n=1 Tax=Monocercomonoides exilis TaxID=2049356 RepID=UPI0035596FA4|nr:hypothetical protein MONOS_7939 [Monocercomonoides exilis]|eukprot:MONOS_7939.1-p1 / transcript=MONOS_7939.1 / gene=MONOS_7939 / organism=Monocercomonoides_exilis_PA203 / gene_product=unspecified product / transcript_product=unspecified product / location=Mono_scaffold00286:16841-18421(-) / protein_length=505 / sequence_SO=supercontig / SO=protein_coding / is_pseudo=false